MGQTDIRLLQETTTLAAQTTQVLKNVPRLSNTHPLAHERHYSTQHRCAPFLRKDHAPTSTESTLSTSELWLSSTSTYRL